jgi:hypothetical protein
MGSSDLTRSSPAENVKAGDAMNNAVRAENKYTFLQLSFSKIFLGLCNQSSNDEEFF